MKFDYTKGKTETHVVFIRDRVTSDSYRFSDYTGAKALFDKVLAERKDEIASIRLVERRRQGCGNTLETYTNDDELRTAWGSQLAYYDFVDNAVYIRSDAILPNPKKVDRKVFRDAFNKSYEERIELYATDEAKTLIRNFITKHAGAKLSEFTTMF